MEGRGHRGQRPSEQDSSEGQQHPSAIPCSSFPLLLAALEGGREGADVPSHLWGKCSGDGTLYPALIYLLGSRSLGQLVFTSAGAWNFC